MADWQQISNGQGSNFAMCGVYVNDKLLLGGYGNGAIYSWNPFTTELTDSGEAILAMCVFKGVVYATSENNDMAGQQTRVMRRGTDGHWTPVNISGYAAYFMRVWGDYLIVMTTTDLATTEYWYSSDGITFHHGAHFSNWLWVPTIYKNELYILGHTGAVQAAGDTKVVKWNGSAFVDVPALCGVSGVTDWQCATEHNGYMFLGAGGWLRGRGTSQATVYRFDGINCAAVKNDSAYHEVQTLLSSTFNNALYATFGHGFKTDEGGSKIWASVDNGATWADAGSFSNCPQLYVMMDTPYGYIAAGGFAGGCMVYYYDTRAITPPDPPRPLVPSVPDSVVVYSMSETETRIYWSASTNASGYQVSVRTTNSLNNYVEVYYPGYTTAPDVDFLYTPWIPGYLEARVKALGGFVDPGNGKKPTWATESEWSAWSPRIPVLTPKIELTAPAAPIATAPIAGNAYLTFAGCTQNTAAVTQVFYKVGADPRMLASGIMVASTVSSYMVTDRWVRMVPGEKYVFYLRYHVPNTQIYSPYSAPSADVLVPGSFATPGNFTAGFTNPSVVQLNWIDNAVGEANYVVERWRNGEWLGLVVLPAGATSYIDTTQTLSSLVRYRVMSRGGMVHSEWATSGLLPTLPNAFPCMLDSYDSAVGEATISFGIANWSMYNGYPYTVAIEQSVDGANYATVRSLYGNNIASPQVLSFAIAKKPYYIRFKASNGAGVVYSNVLTIITLPTLYTIAASPSYEPGKSQGRSVVYGPDGAGETGYALTGFVRHLGYPYAATTNAIGVLTKEAQEAEIITQPVGREWYGEKTTYSAELEGTTNRDVVVSIGSRNDYKVPTFTPGKEVALAGRGRVGYIKAGHEFEVKFKWSSGVPHYFKAWDARIWLKMTGRQGLSTLPYFYGSKGYNPKGGAK